MRRALVVTALLASMTVLAGGGRAGTAEAATCPALDYEAGLVAAAGALQEAPPDVAAAQHAVDGLVAADPASRVALQPVIGDLSAASPDVTDAELRLASMSATLAYPKGSVCNENADAARNALHGVYASPDFRHLDDAAPTNPLAGILNAIAGALSRGAGALGPVGAALLATAVLAVALALAWRRWRGAAALRSAAIDEPASVGDDPDAEWKAAERAAAAGAFREAVRRAFRSALLEVAIRGRVRIDAAWTTRELLARVDASGEVLLALAASAAVFERAWYSGVAVTRADWLRAEDRCATVRRLARTPTRVVR